MICSIRPVVMYKIICLWFASGITRVGFCSIIETNLPTFSSRTTRHRESRRCIWFASTISKQCAMVVLITYTRSRLSSLSVSSVVSFEAESVDFEALTEGE